ncbi:unnamed protein product, partial [Rotaria sp. Silwood2]
MCDILTSLSIVNKRLHSVAINYHRFQLDFKYVKKWQDFNYFCRRSLPLSFQIVSVKLMNQHDAVMPLKIHQFFSDLKITKNTFPILNSLSISHIDHNLWKSIKGDIRQIKSLISISIYLSTTLKYNPACQLTVDILRDLLYWSSTLKNVYIEADDRLVDISRFNLRREQISSIEHLTLRYITINIQHLYSIVPDLRSFD